jgi:hypothetical protein
VKLFGLEVKKVKKDGHIKNAKPVTIIVKQGDEILYTRTADMVMVSATDIYTNHLAYFTAIAGVQSPSIRGQAYMNLGAAISQVQDKPQDAAKFTPHTDPCNEEEDDEPEDEPNEDDDLSEECHGCDSECSDCEHCNDSEEEDDTPGPCPNSDTDKTADTISNDDETTPGAETL